MQYPVTPSDIHATQAFTQLEQGLNEVLDDYLHHVSELLSKTYFASDMSSILVEGTKHYAVVYGFNCRELKDSTVGHWSVQQKMMEECFRDINNINAEYE